MDSCPRAAISSWLGWRAAANCFPQNLVLFADKLLGTQSLCLFRGRHKQISLEVPRPDAIFIAPRVPLIPCGSMCKLILYAAHLNGANCISPLDNILLLPVIPGVSSIYVGALERERFSEHPEVQVSFGKRSPHQDSGTSLENFKENLKLTLWLDYGVSLEMELMGCKEFPVLVEVCYCHFLCAVGVGAPLGALSLLESRSRAQGRERERKNKKAN